jgi:hypothetical protein
MPPNNLKEMRDCRVMLFPHVYLPGYFLNRISAVFGTISICRPWFMDAPLPEIEGVDPSFIHTFRPPESLKPNEDFKRLLAEYRTWMRYHQDGALAANHVASQAMLLSDERAWEIRKLIRGTERDESAKAIDNAFKWHLILHLAREFEQNQADAKEMLNRVKQQKSPLEGALEGEEPLKGLLEDLPPSGPDSSMDGTRLNRVFEAWFGLFGQTLGDHDALLTLDQNVMAYSAELFEVESDEQLEPLLNGDRIAAKRLPVLFHDRKPQDDPVKTGLSGKTIILLMADSFYTVP